MANRQFGAKEYDRFQLNRLPLWDDLALLDETLGTHFSFGIDTLAVLSTAFDLSQPGITNAFSNGSGSMSEAVLEPLRAGTINLNAVVQNNQFWLKEAEKFRSIVIRLLGTRK
ncbi:MAG: hypothetical protein IPK68_17535 [Bdellovibrionales bacterium]|nr:hypothetical protein [Bdellovibrionales bacterium]